MSITNCKHCDHQYDQDMDVEHEEVCSETKPKLSKKQRLRGAIARGWTHPKNSHKEMDSDLALAIADEVKQHLAKEISDTRQQTLLELLAHFSEYTVPLTMTAKEVQEEIIKFMEE